MVGAIDGMTYHEAKMKLDPGDALFLFTDGVTEATDINIEEFGEERLEDTLKDCTGHSCQETIDMVAENVKAFVGEAEQSDDITMLVLKRKS